MSRDSDWGELSDKLDALFAARPGGGAAGGGSPAGSARSRDRSRDRDGDRGTRDRIPERDRHRVPERSHDRNPAHRPPPPSAHAARPGVGVDVGVGGIRPAVSPPRGAPTAAASAGPLSALLQSIDDIDFGPSPGTDGHHPAPLQTPMHRGPPPMIGGGGGGGGSSTKAIPPRTHVAGTGGARHAGPMDRDDARAAIRAARAMAHPVPHPARGTSRDPPIVPRVAVPPRQHPPQTLGRGTATPPGTAPGGAGAGAATRRLPVPLDLTAAAGAVPRRQASTTPTYASRHDLPTAVDPPPGHGTFPLPPPPHAANGHLETPMRRHFPGDAAGPPTARDPIRVDPGRPLPPEPTMLSDLHSRDGRDVRDAREAREAGRPRGRRPSGISATSVVDPSDHATMTGLVGDAIEDAAAFTVVPAARHDEQRRDAQRLRQTAARLQNRLTLETKVREAAFIFAQSNRGDGGAQERLAAATSKVDAVHTELTAATAQLAAADGAMLRHIGGVLRWEVVRLRDMAGNGVGGSGGVVLGADGRTHDDAASLRSAELKIREQAREIMLLKQSVDDLEAGGASRQAQQLQLELATVQAQLATTQEDNAALRQQLVTERQRGEDDAARLDDANRQLVHLRSETEETATQLEMLRAAQDAQQRRVGGAPPVDAAGFATTDAGLRRQAAALEEHLRAARRDLRRMHRDADDAARARARLDRERDRAQQLEARVERLQRDYARAMREAVGAGPAPSLAQGAGSIAATRTLVNEDGADELDGLHRDGDRGRDSDRGGKGALGSSDRPRLDDQQEMIRHLEKQLAQARSAASHAADAMDRTALSAADIGRLESLLDTLAQSDHDDDAGGGGAARRDRCPPLKRSAPFSADALVLRVNHVLQDRARLQDRVAELLDAAARSIPPHGGRGVRGDPTARAEELEALLERERRALRPLQRDLDAAQADVARLQERLESAQADKRDREVRIGEIENALVTLERSTPAAVRRAADAAVDAARAERQAEVDEAAARVRTLEQALADAEQAREDAAADHARAIAALRREMDAAESRSQASLAQTHGEHVRKLEAQHQTEVARLHVALDDAKHDWEQQTRRDIEDALARAAEQHQRQLAECSREHDEAIEEAAGRHRREVAHLQDRLKSSEANLVAAKQSLFAEREQLNEQIDQVTSRLREKEDALSKTEGRYAEYDSQILLLQADIDRLKASESDRRAMVKDLQGQLDNSEQERHTLQTTVSEHAAQVQRVQREKQLLERQRGADREEFEQQLAKARATHDAALQRIADMQRAMDDMAKQLREMAELRRQITAMEAALQESQTYADAMERQYTETHQQQSAQALEVSSLRRQADTATREMEDMQSEVRTLRKHLAQADKDASELISLRHQLEVAKRNLRDAHEEIERTKRSRNATLTANGGNGGNEAHLIEQLATVQMKLVDLQAAKTDLMDDLEMYRTKEATDKAELIRRDAETTRMQDVVRTLQQDVARLERTTREQRAKMAELHTKLQETTLEAITGAAGATLPREGPAADVLAAAKVEYLKLADTIRREMTERLNAEIAEKEALANHLRRFRDSDAIDAEAAAAAEAEAKTAHDEKPKAKTGLSAWFGG